MPLRLLSYNILYGGEDRLAHIHNVIQRQQPDAVALLEANDQHNAETLARQLQMEIAFGPANSEFHIAWMSCLPIERVKNHRQAAFSKTLLEIEVQWQGTPLSLFATHLSAGRDQESETRRVKEMRAILDILRQCERPAHALVGDFNSLHPTDSADISLYLATGAEEGEEQLRADQFPRQVIPLPLEAGYTDCYRVLHKHEPGYTYKLPAPSLRLDYIFAAPALAARLSQCSVIAEKEAHIASDHLPILAEFI